MRGGRSSAIALLAGGALLLTGCGIGEKKNQQVNSIEDPLESQTAAPQAPADVKTCTPDQLEGSFLGAAAAGEIYYTIFLTNKSSTWCALRNESVKLFGYDSTGNRESIDTSPQTSGSIDATIGRADPAAPPGGRLLAEIYTKASCGATTAGEYKGKLALQLSTGFLDLAPQNDAGAKNTLSLACPILVAGFAGEAV